MSTDPTSMPLATLAMTALSPSLPEATLPQAPVTAPEETTPAKPAVVLRQRSLLEMIVGISTLTLPPLGMLAAIIVFWGRGVGVTELLLFAVFYLISGLGITVGYHRLFTHRAFETNAFFRFLIGVGGSMAMEGSVLAWVDTHRRHHRHSDEVKDPHSPHQHGAGLVGRIRGFFHAHMGWLVVDKPEANFPEAADLAAEKVCRVVDRLYLLWVFLGLAIPAAIAGLIAGSWMGALYGLIWGGFARIFAMHHATWSVNSICHIWGGQQYRSSDQSRNNLAVALLSMGEGWHNNHHAFPTSARHGLSWWQFDLSYIVIRTMEILGLARNVRRPSASAMAAKRVA